ncbi:uncharacterized protein LOC124146734 [Haliotis rufescens]|uniref:uncharacterized protein LOC124146734 n=1 Tax=Haliotis rufescens TaxID=6454 RepID=UPI00201F1A6D|nr:uncharacterized protein LOC124146734 [Haliotis rufescens]
MVKMEILPVVLIFILGAENLRDVDASVSVHTPSQQSYLPLAPLGVTVYMRTSVRFNLTAANDAHIGLYTPDNGAVPQDMYEIVIGGWGNTKSVIRIRQQGSIKDSKNHTPLDSSRAKPFWVSWSSGVIKVGTGTEVGVSTFMQLADTTHHVTSIAVTTGWGSTGDWVFEEEHFSSSLLPSSTIQRLNTMLDSSYLEDTISSDYTSQTSPLTVNSTTEIQFPLPSEVSSSLLHTLTFVDTYKFLTVTSFSSSFGVPSLVSTANGITSLISSLEDISPTSSLPGVTSLVSTHMTLNETASILQTTMGVALPSMDTTSSGTPSNSSNLCRCRCRSSLSLSSEEFKDVVNAIVKELSIPKYNLSSSLRKRKTMSDGRPSSVGIGSGAIFLVMIPVAIVVLLDLHNLFSCLMTKR